MSTYDVFARFYDLDTEGFDADLPFWVNLARRTGGPILEVGCGTGRVLLPLARAGLSVVGVDVSPSMLAIAHDKIAQAGQSTRITLVEADALTLQLKRRFNLAFIALNSFGHFFEPGAAERVLERINANLVPNGLLALDLPNPTHGVFGETTGVLLHEYIRPGPTPGWQTVKLRSQQLNQVDQRVDVSCMYDEVSPTGDIRRTLATFVLRYFYPYELELLLDRAGYTVESMYGGYDLEPLDDSSDRLIVVARAHGEHSP